MPTHWGRGLCLLLVLCSAVAAPLRAQETAGEGPDAVAEEAEGTAGPTLDRSQWLVLVVLLGETLPDEVILTDIAFNVAPADARIHVALPRDRAAELEMALAKALGAHFPRVTITETPTPETSLYAERDITVTGIPSFAEYRARSRVADPAADAPPPPAPPEAPAAAPPPPPEDTWPDMQVQRVFAQAGGGGMVAQVTVRRRAYIVRDGKTFANRQYRFAGVATGEAPMPGTQCITIEDVTTGETRVLCTRP